MACVAQKRKVKASIVVGIKEGDLQDLQARLCKGSKQRLREPSFLSSVFVVVSQITLRNSAPFKKIRVVLGSVLAAFQLILVVGLATSSNHCGLITEALGSMATFPNSGIRIWRVW